MNNMITRLKEIDKERKKLRSLIIKNIRNLASVLNLNEVCKKAGLPTTLDNKLQNGRMTEYSDSSLVSILKTMEEMICQKQVLKK